MPSGTSSSAGERSRIPQFDHKNLSKPRAERWRAFAKSLQSYMGTKASRYVSYILRNDLDETEPNCNLPDELFTAVINMSSVKKSDAAQDAFATAQWHLQQCLDENFGQTDEATLTKYSHAAVTARIRERNEDLTPQDPVLRFLPFASLCYQELESKYNDVGATDALHKLFAFEAAKTFSPSNVHPWISTVENTWAQVSAIATDPSYLAALQLLLSIKGCQNETWVSWAGMFAHDMRDKPFTVATLLERVRAANALEDVTSKSPAAVVNYANKQHTRSQPNGWDKGKTKSLIKKKLRLCSTPGCTTPTPTRHMSLCKKHFAQSKNESDDTSSVSDNAKDKVKTKSLLKAKKGLVKAAKKVKGLQEALALAAEVSSASPEVHATFTQLPSAPDDSASALISDQADAFIGPALPGDETSTTAAPSLPKKKKKKRKLDEVSSTPILVQKGKSSKVKLSQLSGKSKLLGNTVAQKRKKAAAAKKRKKANATVMHAVQDIDWSTMSIQQFSRPSHSD